MGGCSDAKVTVMVLKVDLDCCQCYRKIKRLLCKYPQIRDQVFDAKQNTVTITVVCCSPEKIRDKLLSKGGKSIKAIQIKDSKKPVDKPKPMPQPADQIQGGDKPGKPKAAAPQAQPQADKPDKQKPQPQPQPQPSDGGAAEKPKKAAADQEKPKAKDAAAEAQEKKGADTVAAPAAQEKKGADTVAAPASKPTDPSKLVGPEAQWVPGYGYPAPGWAPPLVYPVAIYDHGYGNGYGRRAYPTPPGPGPSYYAHSHSHPCRFDHYFTDENPTACSIM